MELTIEHLAAYLPYGLKVAHTNHIEFLKVVERIDTLNGIYKDCCTFDLGADWYFDTDENDCSIKPILHPLSDLTKPIKVDGYNDGKEFVPYLMIEDLGLAKNVSLSFAAVVFSFNSYYSISISERLSCIKYDLKEEIGQINKLPNSIVNLLYKWHFDVFGLIDNNLAIDINTLK